VRIGDLTPPRSGVVLDLNGSNNTATAGLGLPVVALEDVASPLPLAASFDDLAGVVVYNSTMGNGLRVGIYFVSEKQWVRVRTDATDFPFVYTNAEHTKYLYMLPYKLGVTDEGKSMTVEEQMEAAKNLTESNDVPAITGHLFQWGRVDDGHELRSSGTYGGPVAVSSSDGQVAEGDAAYGKFILATDWRQYGDKSASNPPSEWRPDPCSSVKDGGKAWRLPTSDEWKQITDYNSRETTENPRGLRLKPDGSTVSVFLPAAGYRGRADGAFSSVGASGVYWSSSPSGTNASNLYFSTTVYPESSDYRSFGFSVRCVAE
jgi:uncharacterized protein (TIGR02145 family)